MIMESHKPMNHLAQDQLYAFAFDGVQPGAVATAHLADCTECRAQLAELTVLAAGLAVARQSTPSAAALQRYNQLFAQAPAPKSRLANLIETIRASVLWNGREQAQAQGVRNAALTGYRLLYATPQAEVELLVEQRDGNFTLDGEVLPIASTTQETLPLLPMWLELQQPDGTPLVTGESDEYGRFRFADLPTGNYALYLLPPTGAALLLEALELA